jgi:hypothetical protein
MSKTPADLFLSQVRWSIPCCPNCEHFKDVLHVTMTGDGFVETKKEYCGLDPQKRLPPAKIVAFGCPRFVQDIPF